MWVETLPSQNNHRFHGPVNLNNGLVESDILGQRVTPQFLTWAREKMGWKPPQE